MGYLWHALMYGVGVFVTCNVGGQILLRLFAGRKRKRLPAAVGAGRADVRADEASYAVVYGGELVKVHGGGQSFEDMRRQTEAGRRRDANAPEESGRRTDADTPNESGRRTDGGLAPGESVDAVRMNADGASVEGVTETDGDDEWKLLTGAA